MNITHTTSKSNAKSKSSIKKDLPRHAPKNVVYNREIEILCGTTAAKIFNTIEYRLTSKFARKIDGRLWADIDRKKTADKISVSKITIRRHTAELIQIGLLDVQKIGLRNFYAVNWDRVDEITRDQNEPLIGIKMSPNRDQNEPYASPESFAAQDVHVSLIEKYIEQSIDKGGNIDVSEFIPTAVFAPPPQEVENLPPDEATKLAQDLVRNGRKFYPEAKFDVKAAESLARVMKERYKLPSYEEVWQIIQAAVRHKGDWYVRKLLTNPASMLKRNKEGVVYIDEARDVWKKQGSQNRRERY